LSLFVYARHTADCPKKSDRFWKRCRCPKWIRGILNGSPVRQTAETRSWEKAEDKRRRLEETAEEQAVAIRGGQPASREPELVSVPTAVKRFLASKRIENRRPPKPIGSPGQRGHHPSHLPRRDTAQKGVRPSSHHEKGKSADGLHICEGRTGRTRSSIENRRLFS
jgi:hypothetical protein